jgi:WD40 repeat protein
VLPGHSNRVFCLKFDPLEENILYSGGWDKSIQIYDLRMEGPVTSLSGPMITGDSIEVHPADHYLVTGCYQSQENIKIWDLRTLGCTKVLDWEGKGYRDPVPDDYNVMEHSPDSPELKKPHSKTMLNTLKFSRRLDMILAGGSGKSEVRAFDIKTGEIVAQITDLEKSVLCMDFAHTKDQFAFGSVDSCMRVMNFSKY